MKKTFSTFFLFVFYVACFAQASKPILKYGPVIKTTHTVSYFNTINNTEVPDRPVEGYPSYSETILIQGNQPNKFSTFILDIGENKGDYIGLHTPQIIIFNLDQGQGSYEAIPIRDENGGNFNNNTISLGRCDGKATIGPGGRIYSYEHTWVSYRV